MKALNFGRTLRNAGTWLKNTLGFGDNNHSQPIYGFSSGPAFAYATPGTNSAVSNGETNGAIKIGRRGRNITRRALAMSRLSRRLRNKRGSHPAI